MAKNYDWDTDFDDNELDDWDYKPSKKVEKTKTANLPKKVYPTKTIEEPPVKLKNSTLSIIAIVFSFFPVLNLVSIILAMIDLIKRRDEDIPRKHSLSAGALVLCGLNYIWLFGLLSGSSSKPHKVEKQQAAEIAEESISEELTQYEDNDTEIEPSNIQEEEINEENKKSEIELTSELIEQPTNSDLPNDIFLIGETAELNDIQVTLNGYYESHGDEISAPENGNTFFYAEIDIANNSNETIAISSMLSFEAYADDYAVEFSFPAMITKDMGQQLDGEIESGKKMRGTVGYEIPESWEKVEIHFKDNVWLNNKYKFLVYRENQPMK